MLASGFTQIHSHLREVPSRRVKYRLLLVSIMVLEWHSMPLGIVVFPMEWLIFQG